MTAGGTTLIDAVGYNERGQLALLSRATGAPDTNVTYYNSGANFGRLSQIRVGSTADVYPDYNYTAYDSVGNLKAMAATKGNVGAYTFGYDEMNRLKTAVLTGASGANYNYAYSYNELGNIMSRAGTDPDMTYSYTDPAHKQAVTGISGGMSASYSYGQRGNMLARTVNNLTYTQTFDVEGRLDSVTVGGQTTTFAYDAAGQRVLTVLPGDNPTRIYTPFPDYEVEDSPTGDNITRTTYRLAGQMVAVQKRVGAGAGTFAYTYTDHLGNLVDLSSLTGVLDATSLARYDPFGNFRTTPATNPGMTDQGFTGHRHNNTGANNLGLIYMNARYYLPEVGRFVSADTIVPEPENPQSYNRYAYTLNNPINLTDPSGHRPTSGCGEVETGCTLADELDPDRTYIDNNGSPVWADPNLVERYPGRPLGEIAAWTGVGLIGGSAGSVLLEAGASAIASSTVLGGAGSAACAAGVCPKVGSEIIQYAQSLQGSGTYPGVDEFSEAILKKGELIVGAAEGQGQTAFYTTLDSLLRSGQHAETLWKGLQVAPDAEQGYRQVVTIYQALSDITVAIGQVSANPRWGSGGYTQIVVENFQEVLAPIVSILLK